MVPEMNDKSLMPFGKHKGTAMANVPANYLLYIYENMTLHDNLKNYIQKNLEGLRAEVKRAARESKR